MCKNPHLDMDRPAVAELMAGVSAALARRVSVLCEDVYEVILREIPQLNGDKPVLTLLSSSVHGNVDTCLIPGLRLHWSDQGLDRSEDLMSSTVAGLPGTVGPPDRAGNTRGPASLQMLDGTNGAARLVFESGGRRHAAQLN
jgi:hypothetical protein